MDMKILTVNKMNAWFPPAHWALLVIRIPGVQETLESLKVTLSNEDVQELQDFANKADIEDLWKIKMH
ncbi:hypothetical protein MJO29_012542 [Puccinia striiformis f. sp. tritici]|nr:hypothetical protein MJO29_012542 [Puccinia striiformis f. sp. tritici]